MDDPSVVRRIGWMGILREALLLPFRNKKLMLPIMLLSFLLSLLQHGSFVSIHPLFKDFITKLYVLTQLHPGMPPYYDLIQGIQDEVRFVLKIDPILAASSFVISTFSMMYLVHASAMVYSGEQPTFSQLYKRTRGTINAVLLTRIQFSLLYYGYTFMSIATALNLMLINPRWAPVPPIALGGGILVAARVLYVYLSMVWKVGVVMSVLEEGCYGFEALGKAGKVVDGMRVRGFVISFVLMAMREVIDWSYSYVQFQFVPRGQFLMHLLLNKLFQMVFAVFFLECRKKKNDGKSIKREEHHETFMLAL